MTTNQDGRSSTTTPLPLKAPAVIRHSTQLHGSALGSQIILDTHPNKFLLVVVAVGSNITDGSDSRSSMSTVVVIVLPPPPHIIALLLPPTIRNCLYPLER